MCFRHAIERHLRARGHQAFPQAASVYLSHHAWSAANTCLFTMQLTTIITIQFLYLDILVNADIRFALTLTTTNSQASGNSSESIASRDGGVYQNLSSRQPKKEIVNEQKDGGRPRRHRERAGRTDGLFLFVEQQLVGRRERAGQ
jgi:hypothetical protein